jgi:hypothetical protein
MPKPEMEFFDVGKIPWKPIPGVTGLAERTISADPETGDYTRMLRFEPGTNSSPMGVQRHDFWEEVFILEGSLHDLTLNRTFTKGMYACRPPNMPHGPWVSPDGCVTLEIRYYKK